MAKTSKPKTEFTCTACGSISPKWLGRCPACNAWGTLEEARKDKDQHRAVQGWVSKRAGAKPTPITQVDVQDVRRASTGWGEVDRVLGGGIIPGSVTLIGGAPGVGKSTLLLAMASSWCKNHGDVLYVSGEESLSQTRLRAERLDALHDNLYLYSEIDVAQVIDHAKRLKPSLIIIDSIQTFFHPDFQSAPGSIAQVKEVTLRLTHFAKGSETPVLVVGHINKDGAVAGPKVLEHIVDTVLFFEHMFGGATRLLRTTKNRFGATHELGVLEMQSSGLKEVSNPSSLFLSDREQDKRGSSITAVLEGTRPILVEIQALTIDSHFGNPQRTVVGVERNRVQMILAVLERICDIPLSSQDVFINVVGGLTLHDPGADLAIAMAILSAYYQRSLPMNGVFVGEIGLSGEVRNIANLEPRITECAKLGFKNICLPKIPKAELGRDGPCLKETPTLEAAKNLYF